MIDPRLYGKQPDGGWVLDQDHDITKWDWTRPPEHSEKFYSEDQPRDERGRWTNADGGGRSISQPTLSPRATRALKSHKPMTKEKEEIATAMEWKITALLRGEHTDDDLPPDVTLTINGQFHGLDVKTNIDGKHDKVTVHPDSRIRKEECIPPQQIVNIKLKTKNSTPNFSKSFLT